MFDDSMEGVAFGSVETAVLKQAYDTALAELERKAAIGGDDRSKLAKAVIAIGQRHLRTTGELFGDRDAHRIASLARQRLAKGATVHVIAGPIRRQS